MTVTVNAARDIADRAGVAAGGHDAAQGLATAERFLAEVAAQDAAIVCFPETYLPGYRGRDFPTTPPDQRAQERALRGVSELARRHRVAVIMPMEWASPAGLLNLAFVVNADGTIQGYQTKNQLAIEEEPQYVPGATRWTWSTNR